MGDRVETGINSSINAGSYIRDDVLIRLDKVASGVIASAPGIKLHWINHQISRQPVPNSRSGV